jgi:hypothetical protein
MELWIARDKDGSLWMYDDEPVLRSENSFGVKTKYNGETKPAKRLYSWYFPEVTFENSPQMVEIKLIKEE